MRLHVPVGTLGIHASNDIAGCPEGQRKRGTSKYTPKRCAHPGCERWLPAPERGRPPLRCYEHGPKHARKQQQKWNWTAYRRRLARGQVAA